MAEISGFFGGGDGSQRPTFFAGPLIFNASKGRSRMAKGKHATALFEVIHAKDKPGIPRKTTGFATPGWWFKSKPDKRAATDRSDPPVPGLDAMAAARAELAAMNSAAATEPAPRVIERIVEIEKPVYIDRPVPVPTRSFGLDDDTPLRLDPANHEIKFRLSYLGAVAAGFVLIVIVAMAYLFGTHSGDVSLSDPSAVTGSTVGDIHTPAAPLAAGQQLMAAVSQTALTAPPPQAAVDIEPTRADAPVAPVSDPTLSPSLTEPPANESTPASVDRQIGLHYVIVQSYPQIATAQKATAFLNARGIPCTLIPGPPNWAPRGWYSVVGTESFDHIRNNPALDAYIQSIEALATDFAGSQRFNRFKPSPYKWTDRSTGR